MDYSYDFAYGMDDELTAAVGVVYLIYYLISIGFGIATYVLSSLGLYTIAKRRGITSPWLAWIPVANMWIVGSISDQYRYVTKGQIKNKRKILVGLEIALFVLLFVILGSIIAMSMSMDVSAGLVLTLLLVFLALFGIAITYSVFYYMAMYDVYTSVNPPYNVVFLVLSIIFHVTEPFFIFFNRKKDLGMPPRCDIPAQPVQPAPQFLPPQQPIQEPWENVTEE